MRSGTVGDEIAEGLAGCFLGVIVVALVVGAALGSLATWLVMR